MTGVGHHCAKHLASVLVSDEPAETPCPVVLSPCGDQTPLAVNLTELTLNEAQVTLRLEVTFSNVKPENLKEIYFHNLGCGKIWNGRGGGSTIISNPSNPKMHWCKACCHITLKQWRCVLRREY